MFAPVLSHTPYVRLAQTRSIGTTTRLRGYPFTSGFANGGVRADGASRGFPVRRSMTIAGSCEGRLHVRYGTLPLARVFQVFASISFDNPDRSVAVADYEVRTVVSDNPAAGGLVLDSEARYYLFL